MSESKLEVLKQELVNTLEQSNVDYGKVLELSAKIAALDDQHVRFSVDAGHISRLGRELVGRQETAVSELVKNAYDADATKVKLTFIDTDKPGGTLLIEDDGHGMTHTQLVNGFMRLSSTEKIHEPISPKYKRKRAGRKGIGRFAAQRLGKTLNITTQTWGTGPALKVEFDWLEFAEDKDINSIANQLSKTEKERPHGTTLAITQLEESWTETTIKRAYRYLIDLIQPFPLSETDDDSVDDPGFIVEIFKVGDGETREIASVDKLVYDFAVAKIEATVDENGKAIWSLNSERFEIDDLEVLVSDNEPLIYEHLKDVYLIAYYYIYRAKLLPRNQEKLILEMAKERGGIRIYRNGFRVLPYGETDDDWLKLDESSARRHILPPHANINFFGFVQLTDISGQYFEETASRENLIVNNAYTELVDFSSRVLRSAALRVAAARERKQTATQTSWDSQQDPISRINEAVDILSTLANDLEEMVSESDSVDESSIPPSLINILRNSIDKITQASEDQEIKFISQADKMTMLRVLASLGQAIGEFTHEIKHLLGAMRADARYFVDTAISEEQRKKAETLLTNINNFAAYTAYFDRIASENARREMDIQDLARTARIFHNNLADSALTRYAISIAEPEINGYDLFTLPMHPSELQSILLNFYTNSRKAVKRNNVSGCIKISVGKVDGRIVFLEFADNGVGIAPDIENRIFDPFFSTGAPAGPDADENEESTGSGLGLSIVRDIVEGYDGTIELVTPPTNFNTCFRIELPIATREQIEDYGY